jgi:hypothetical protein
VNLRGEKVAKVARAARSGIRALPEKHKEIQMKYEKCTFFPEQGYWKIPRGKMPLLVRL